MHEHRSGFVTLVGRPNSGKSTLLNTLVGQKISIVSDKPQTTRNRILGMLNRPHCQIIFVDTPGIHRPLFEMNRRMMAITRSAAEGMDIIVLLVDGTLPFGRGDLFAVEMLCGLNKPVVLLINKIDRMRKPDILPIIDHYRRLHEFTEIIPISALTGENVEPLIESVAARLPPGPAYFDGDMITDQPERFLVAEMVRERLLAHTEEELPYSTCVLVDRLEEASHGGVVKVHAVIYVEKDSQKGIVIGRQGALLKRIGSEARREIEKALNSKVFLSLRVKVRKQWRNDVRHLKNLGLLER